LGRERGPHRAHAPRVFSALLNKSPKKVRDPLSRLPALGRQDRPGRWPHQLRADGLWISQLAPLNSHCRPMYLRGGEGERSETAERRHALSGELHTAMARHSQTRYGSVTGQRKDVVASQAVPVRLKVLLPERPDRVHEGARSYKLVVGVSRGAPAAGSPALACEKARPARFRSCHICQDTRNQGPFGILHTGFLVEHTRLWLVAVHVLAIV